MLIYGTCDCGNESFARNDSDCITVQPDVLYCNRSVLKHRARLGLAQLPSSEEAMSNFYNSIRHR